MARSTTATKTRNELAEPVAQIKNPTRKTLSVKLTVSRYNKLVEVCNKKEITLTRAIEQLIDQLEVV